VVCGKCSDSGEFRVLRCGDALCFKCLKANYQVHNGAIICPYDEITDTREPDALPTLEEFYSIPDYNSGETSGTRRCEECNEFIEFRVLSCGHAVCFECVKRVHEKSKRNIICLFDRLVNLRKPHDLPKPNEFNGKIFYCTPEEAIELNLLVDRMVGQRKITIKHLRGAASTLKSIGNKFAISKITGSATGITGSILTIVGISLTITGAGALFGVPMAIAGASIGAVGGATTGVSAVVETTVERKKRRDVQADLDIDKFRAKQVCALLQKAAKDPKLAETWKIDPALLANVARSFPAIAKVGVTNAAGAEVAFGILRTTAGTALHIAGLALATALIPLDMAQLIINSIKIHKDRPSAVVTQISDIADRLEENLRIFLIKEQLFQKVSTKDKHWAYILLTAEKKEQSEE